jgi:hypothetical protein
MGVTSRARSSGVSLGDASLEALRHVHGLLNLGCCQVAAWLNIVHSTKVLSEYGWRIVVNGVIKRDKFTTRTNIVTELLYTVTGFPIHPFFIACWTTGNHALAIFTYPALVGCTPSNKSVDSTDAMLASKMCWPDAVRLLTSCVIAALYVFTVGWAEGRGVSVATISAVSGHAAKMESMRVERRLGAVEMLPPKTSLVPAIRRTT